MRVLLFIVLTLFGYGMLLLWRSGATTDWNWFAGGVSSILLGLMFLFMEKRKVTEEFVNFRKPNIVECLSLIALLILGLLVFISGITWGPPKIEEVRKKLVNKIVGVEEVVDPSEIDKFGSHDDKADGSITQGIVGNNEGPFMRIPERIDLQLPKLPELWIKPDDTLTRELMLEKRFFVRGKSLNKFDGNLLWSAKDPVFKSLNAKESGVIDLTKTKTGDKYVYNVVQKTSLKNLYGLVGLEKVTLPRVKHATGSHYILPTISDDDETRTYTCVSTPVFFDSLTAKEKSDVKIGKVAPIYSENRFSNSLREKLIQESIRIRTAGFTNPVQQLEAVQKILLNGYDYSLNVENKQNYPPIENFLYHEKKGYCIHFATAAALLLRELNIPCRVSTGFSKGTYFTDDDTWVCYSHNAHAWVEVYLKKYGWVVFDTTPPSGLTGGDSVEGESVGAFPTEEEERSAYDALNKEKAKLSGTDNGNAELLNSATNQLRIVFALIFILLIILIGFGMLQKFGNRKNKARVAEDDERVVYTEKEYIANYRYMSKLNSLPMMEGDTLANHVSWLEKMEKKPDFADELLKYHYNSTYRMHERDKSTESKLLKKIKAWKG